MFCCVCVFTPSTSLFFSISEYFSILFNYHKGVDLIRHGWSRKGPNVSQEGYGSAAVLPEQGFYLAAAIYRPVLQVSDFYLCK